MSNLYDRDGAPIDYRAAGILQERYEQNRRPRGYCRWAFGDCECRECLRYEYEEAHS